MLSVQEITHKMREQESVKIGGFLFFRDYFSSNLIGFLNLMLMPQSPIVDLEFMNNESLPVSRDHKGCVFDIICKDTNDDRFLIEVQTSQAVNIVERIIYYTCRLMDRMGKRGIYTYSKTVDPYWINRFIAGCYCWGIFKSIM